VTTNRERRASEHALIETAVAYRHHGDYFNHVAFCNAVDAYLASGPDPTTGPRVGHDHPETSHDAAESVRSSLGKLARAVYDEILIVHQASGSGLTVDQLEQILGRSHQSVSARVNELRDKHWVKDSGQRRKTRSGRQAIVWVPTIVALTQGARRPGEPS